MKNFKIALGLLISLIFAGNSYAWTITDFHSDIQLNSDGSANVTETIQADFSQDSGKHGIFRFIPFQTKTDTGKLNRTPISNISVLDQQQFSRNFRQETKNDNVLLVIGDPNRFVNPQETYVIKYRVDRVPKEFPENNFAEFYWNVTGDDWDTTIQKASATISLPTPSKINKTTCFTGRHGSKEQNCSARMANGKAFFATNSPLYSGQGFTIDYGFDKGIVQTFQFEDLPQLPQNFAEKSKFAEFFDRIGIWILSALIFLFPTFFAWRERKKVAVDKPIIPKYEPPEGFHPAVLGTIIDGNFDKQDFTAGIIDLAVNGYLTIGKKKIEGLLWDSEEYFFKRNPAKNFTTDIQKDFYNGLFRPSLTANLTGVISALQGKEIEDLTTLKDEVVPAQEKNKMFSVFREMELKIKTLGKEYFNKISGKGGLVLLVPITAMGIPIIMMNQAENLFEGKLFLLFIAVFIGIAAFIMIFPKHTLKGMNLAHEAKCYREFLKTAELDQLNWAEKQEIFEKNLPYAVAFGLTSKWAKVFGDTIVEPKWIQGAGGVGNLAESLDQITSDIAGNIQAPRSSSGGSGFGGGFSGGGSGGGGGGSW